MITVLQAIKILQNMPGDLPLVVLESKKHEDNAPLMEVISIEETNTDQEDDVCQITIDPNPDTIVPLSRSLNPDLKVTAEIMKQAAKKIESHFPGKGFALVVYDFGDGLREFRYISNTQRKDMIASFEALLLKWKNENVANN